MSHKVYSAAAAAAASSSRCFTLRENQSVSGSFVPTVMNQNPVSRLLCQAAGSPVAGQRWLLADRNIPWTARIILELANVFDN